MTGLQALSPMASTEPVAPLDAPAVVQMIISPHKTLNAQVTYEEWKKRLQEAKSEVLIQTYETLALNGQTAIPGPVPKHG